MRHLLFPIFKFSRLGFPRSAGLTFLLRDDFITTESAPLASPRTCEPGPGTLTLVQTDGQFSISGGKLNFPAQASPLFPDQGFFSINFGRSAGRAINTLMRLSTVQVIFPLVWSPNTSLNFTAFTNLTHGFYVTVGSLSVAVLGSSIQVGNPLATATDYQLFVIQRSTGAFWFIKGGVYTNWTLLYVIASGNDSTQYQAMSNASAIGTLDTARTIDLPANGYTIWSDDYGIATQRLAGSVAEGTTFVHEANCLIEWTQTTLPPVLQTRVRFRQQDALNYWDCRVNAAGSISLNEVVGGVVTQRATAASVVSAGHRVLVIADGTTIRGYSNNVLRWTYGSAVNFQTETDGNLEALNGGTIADLIVWPRTLSGAAASSLDAVVNA